jgi:Zn-dependent protease with chaperone function
LSERPNVVLAALLAAAAVVATLVGSGILLLGGEGAEEVGATLVSALSACVFFLLDPAHIPFSSIGIAILALASLAGFTRTAWAYVGARRLLRALPLAERAEGPLAVRARAAGTRLYVLASARPTAFCVGLIRPRIVVSNGLLARLDPEEQEAVVWHEAVHARGREPLKCLLARLAAQTFFWMPVLAALLERYLLVKELAADRAAMARTSRRALAGALTQVLAQPAPAAAVGFGEAAAARVDRLFEPMAPLPRVVAPWQLIASAAVGTALVLALVFPATLDAGQSARIWHMLTTVSLHGLPGMVAGAAMNAIALGGLTLLARRAAR